MDSVLTTAEVAELIFTAAPGVLGVPWVEVSEPEPLETPPPGNTFVVGEENGKQPQKSRLWRSILAMIAAWAFAGVAFVAMVAGQQAVMLGAATIAIACLLYGIKVWHDAGPEPAMPMLAYSEGAAMLHPTAICTPNRRPITGRRV